MLDQEQERHPAVSDKPTSRAAAASARHLTVPHAKACKAVDLLLSKLALLAA